MASGRLHIGEAITPIPEVDGRGGCGADHPFKVAAVSNGMVGFNETAMFNCPMTIAMDDWMEHVVQPNAALLIGQPVIALKLLGTYNCRSIANVRSMSEHSFMNAVDVAAFKFADGHEIVIGRDWKSEDPAVHQFLRLVGDQSCEIFNTVLGPDYNSDHHDHFHMDLAARMRTHKRVCKGGGLRDGPTNYGLPTFTGSISKVDPEENDD